MVQTALVCVEELNTRSREPFSTSYDELHTHGTTVHMSILSSRFMRRVQIMPTSCLARFTGSQCHRAYPTDPCRARGVGNGTASNHANPLGTARMRSTARWAASRHEHRARRRITRSSFELVSTLSAAAHAHHTMAADDTHRAKALAKLLLPAKLMQPPFASTCAECSNPALRRACEGQCRSQGGF